MTQDELFCKIKEQKEFITTGNAVDWVIEKDDEEKKIRLLFQESNGLKDWITNFRFPGKLYKKQNSVLRVHKGYGNAWKSANDSIMNYLIKVCDENPDYKVIIAGWSYGGAMAQLAAEDFNFRTRSNLNNVNSGKKATLVTFGSPKLICGPRTKDYMITCCERIFQYSQCNDMVTYLPPFRGYRQILLPKRIGRKFNLIEWFKPLIYHTRYDDLRLYKDITVEDL